MIRIEDVRPIGSGGTVKQPVVSPTENSSNKGTSFSSQKSVRLIQTVVGDAIKKDATSIHIEPHNKDVVVRYRIDGLLQPGFELQKSSLADLTKSLKQLANLDVDEDRVPQEGKYEIEIADKIFVLRVAIIPVADGEKIVLHVSGQADEVENLEKLGYWGQAREQLLEVTEQTRGLIIISGPAESGKTSTLYSLIKAVSDPTRNISTVEDIIDRRLTGINQTLVNAKAGMTFESTLRAVMRQEPNVLMVSDLHDVHSASITMHAALAGKLVMVGLTSSNIATAVSYLRALKVELYLLAASTRIIVNQRLVRRLCLGCRESYKPSMEEFGSKCLSIGLRPSGVIGRLDDLQKIAAVDLDVKKPKKSASENEPVRLWRASQKGCEKCGFTGYHGRIVIAEALKCTPEIQRLIYSSASSDILYKQAISEGMIPLPLDGLIKVTLGITSIEEICFALSYSEVR